ncbi:Zinc finger, AD-type [Cinara cedri]|uniref:Zinc finger, AD-type n=1 Tax=Cinara cedri TaxID=506608 RepID=A0A5E4NDF8_9HEMI|nr:Zinc finger, AD-type [Cinara cedri]
MAHVYKCRLCDSEYRDQFFVTSIFSEEGRKREFAAKIFYTLWILIIEEENPLYICRSCIKSVEQLYSFIVICRSKNTKIMERLKIPDFHYHWTLRKNPGYLTKPISWFFNHLHGNDLYEATTQIMRNESLPMTKTSMEIVASVQLNVINNINNIGANAANNVNIVHNINAGNGTASQSSLNFTDIPSTSKSHHSVVSLRTKLCNVKNEQRIVIKFLVKSGEKLDEIFRKLQRVFGNDCLSKPRVYEWVARFALGREPTQDDARSGAPKIVHTR